MPLISLREQLQEQVALSLKEFFVSSPDILSVNIEIPNDKKFGDFSTNIALTSAKIFKKSPFELATEFTAAIQEGISASPLKQKIAKIEIVKPGFINFYLSAKATYDILYKVFEQGGNYGMSQFGEGKKIQIEFVSANPTGPLSVAHARQAAVGDAVGNILGFVGFDVKKEYYVNDEGNQINILGQSIKNRALEVLGESIEFPEDGYQGEYIIDMAREFLETENIDYHEAKRNKSCAEEYIAQVNAKDPTAFLQFGVDHLLNVIKEELDDFGVHFDVWAHQSEIATGEKIKAVLEILEQRGFTKEEDGALWFKSTDFGDDKDRVLKKSDGHYTYLTPDIVYHKDKFERNFDKVINIWGPDHHGYIPRIKAAVQALGYDRTAIEVLIVQLATIYRDGTPVSMSTRRGQYISLREVMDEVGVDAARFFFLMRHSNAHLDFDLELAKKETPENPVYYIQYAHARICSIIEKAKEIDLYPKTIEFSLLKEPEELNLAKKIGSFPNILLVCAREMDAFALVNYLLELAACFHKFYDQHRVVDADNMDLSAERLSLIDATRVVLANGLRLLGVSSPQRM